MKKRLFSMMTAFALVAGAMTSCQKDFTEDINKLQSDVNALSTQVSALDAQIKAGAVITSVTQSTTGVTVTLSNGQSFTITNGKDGVDGENGKDGETYVIEIGENGNWLINGVDTGKPSQGAAGEKGTNGENGHTIYYAPENGVWVKYVDGVKDESYVGESIYVEGTLTAVWNDTTKTLEIFGVEGAEGSVVLNYGSEVAVISIISSELVDPTLTFNNTAILNFITISEKSNKFGPNDELVFTDGVVKTTEASVLVRVSPTNAILDPAKIKLINSKGEALDIVSVESAPKAVEDMLLTKAAENGIYKVSFKLQENVTNAAFNAAAKKGAKDILYAIAVENKDGGRAISGYDLTLDKAPVDIAHNTFTVNGTSIDEIHNRYELCDDGFTITTGQNELVWLDDATPAVKAILTGANVNVTGRYYQNGTVLFDDVTTNDNRQAKPVLPVAKGQPINIAIDCDAQGVAINEIAGFYVTLDKDYALESVPSEINAWNSYEYENLNTLIEGNTGSITVKDMNNVAGDVIGFRVYAVNLDGTLLDPDGRSFYVSIEDTPTANTLDVTIVADQVAASTDFIEVSQFAAANDATAWTSTTTVPTTATAAVPFEVEYYKADQTTPTTANSGDAKYIKVKTDNIAKYIDGMTYTQKLDLKKSNPVTGVLYVFKTITLNVTKVMPTEKPEVAFRPMQETVEGSGNFKAYMIPRANPTGNAYDDYSCLPTPATVGSKDLDNIFYNIPDTYVFTIANAKNVSTTAVASYTGGLDVDNTSGFKFEVDNVLIDNTTVHAVTVAEKYPHVSYKYNETAGVYQDGDYYVEGDQNLSVVFSCWHDATTGYAWEYIPATSSTPAVDYTPQLQWLITPAAITANLEHLIGTNTYINEFFGGKVSELLSNNLLKIDDTLDVTLTVNGQTNPYFKATVTGTTVTFTQIGTQIDSNPTADHVETLNIPVVDAFGHKAVISTEVKVLRQN